MDHPFPPLGILYLGTALQKRLIATEVIDGDLLPAEEYEALLSNVQGKLVGLSSTFFHFKEIIRILPLLKMQEKLIVIGGPGISSLIEKEKFLKETGVDFLLEGEAEESLVQLAEQLDDEKRLREVPGLHRLVNGTLESEGTVPRVDVNKYPLPSRNLINIDDYTKQWGNYTGMIITRGCPYTCTFCDLSVVGRKVRYREIGNVIYELNVLANAGLDDVFIFDDLFTVNKHYLRLFAMEKRKACNRLTWGSNARVNLVDDEFCQLVKSSGCTRLFMGIESGSQRMLDKYKKGITREQIINAFNTCHEYGIEPKAYLLIGHPTESWEDIQMTSDLIKKIKPGYVDISVLIPIPGTKLYEETKPLINHDKLMNLDTRQAGTVYKELQYDIKAAQRLLQEAFESTR